MTTATENKYRWNALHFADIPATPTFRRFLDLQIAAHDDMVSVWLTRHYPPENYARTQKIAHKIINKTEKTTQEIMEKLTGKKPNLAETDTVILHISAQQDMVYYLSEMEALNDNTEYSADYFARWSYKKIQSAYTHTKEVIQQLMTPQETEVNG